MNEDDREQWKSDGNCKICRRKEYCGKMCKAGKRAMEVTIGEVLNSIPSYIAMKKALSKTKEEGD
jgi:hypothetical protein